MGLGRRAVILRRCRVPLPFSVSPFTSRGNRVARLEAGGTQIFEVVALHDREHAVCERLLGVELRADAELDARKLIALKLIYYALYSVVTAVRAFAAYSEPAAGGERCRQKLRLSFRAVSCRTRLCRAPPRRSCS